VGTTRQSHDPNRGTRAGLSAFRQRRPPPCPPTASPTIPAHRFHRPRPSPCAAFKRSAPLKSSPFLLLLLPPSPCSPRHSPLPPLHPTPMPLSAQATSLSRSTILKRRFHLELPAVKSPRSHPTSCAVSTEGASSATAISTARKPTPVTPCPDYRRRSSLADLSHRGEPSPALLRPS
jgi:hypothetical protein